MQDIRQLEEAVRAVRFVLHNEPSESLDSPYQEIGRAGRDGEPAEAVLFYRTEDLPLRKFFAGGGDDEARRAFSKSRVEMMRGYAEHHHCRRAFVLSYFGEDGPEECGHCDSCEAGHGRGEGVVQRYDGDHVAILFEEVGYKTLSVELVTERDLLEEAS